MKSTDVPVFDKSMDYLTLVKQQNQRMRSLQANLEFESDKYLELLELVVEVERKLNSEIHLNEAKFLRKRDEKFTRKQL